MCSGSEAGSYLRLIDFVYHSTLGSRAIKKKRKRRMPRLAPPPPPGFGFRLRFKFTIKGFTTHTPPAKTFIMNLGTSVASNKVPRLRITSSSSSLRERRSSWTCAGSAGSSPREVNHSPSACHTTRYFTSFDRLRVGWLNEFSVITFT